jgi:hypothetical protein
MSARISSLLIASMRWQDEFIDPKYFFARTEKRLVYVSLKANSTGAWWEVRYQ